jgi:Undecaprenyl-phosphate galactose phosphotransferase WbaP
MMELAERRFVLRESVIHRGPLLARARARAYQRYRGANAAALALGDTFALLVAIAAATILRNLLFEGVLVPQWVGLVVVMWWVGAWLMQLLPSWGLGPVEELRRMTMLVLSVFAATTVALFLNRDAMESSRAILVFAVIISLFVVPTARVYVKRALIRWHIWGIPVAVYGGRSASANVVDFLEKDKGLGYRPVSVIMADDPAFRTGMTERNIGPGLTVDPVAAILVRDGIGSDQIHQLMQGPLAHYRTVLLIPDLPDVPSLWVRTRDLNGVLGLEVRWHFDSPVYNAFKRVSDLCIVVGLAPLWIPVCVVVGLLIWAEDHDSPIFAQRRVGKRGKAFVTFKFRTMVPDAEAVLQQRLALDTSLRTIWETQYKLKEDPRVTRVGRILRRFSLDELPQLTNVLLGQMSLVGPRPLPMYHHQRLSVDARELRERVRPGLTGFWQVSGRSDVGTDEMERWDGYYVRNWSPWLDAVVLIRTLRVVLKGTGAY